MSGQDLLMYVDLVARKEWIEREKEKTKVEFPFKKRRGGKYRGKEKRENQSVRAKFFLLNFFYG